MCKEQKRRCSFLLLNHRLYYLSISSGRFLVLPIRQKKAQKVILILRVETHKTKKVSVFFKNFEFTPLQNQNFRYNNHRPVRLCSSVGRAGDWKSPCHWFDSDRRHQSGDPAGFPICGRSSSGRAPPCQGGGSEFEPRRPLQKTVEIGKYQFSLIWWRGQVVRQGSAKPSSTSSNLVVTSKRFPNVKAFGIFLFCCILPFPVLQ